MLHHAEVQAEDEDVSLDLVVRSFGGLGATSWTAAGPPLSAAQIGQLTADRPVPADPPRPIGEEDLPLLRALAEDGRATHTRLAELTGWSTPRVARRLAALEAAGSLSYDVDVLPELLGYELNATLWLQVDLARLHRVGEELGGHGECAFAAAISGRHNLMAVVICRDTPDFYRYLTTRLALVEGIAGYEISVRVRRLKQSASLVHRGRLIHPGLA
ncbi:MULTISPECIES: Lrp/AsnC family transcriptional regulator [Kitasatospora]|uniref:Putative AsnC family transcriptional regulator n=1 Tax=Kitasatospora setae (strain ATCC 33774 / DSM 43861 / JCM 3304 / KCC A-0304 / NBRC 14216 / KM-6054) TaxID=452652 RepID=E4N0R1_KITSK|nr:Lrp/AsnC family transcriptional regulator [Kitasatospora setae]BAJ31745.1 putative AsnC family transcriptional regulator [Kitasatospora setae KM-6054]